MSILVALFGCLFLQQADLTGDGCVDLRDFAELQNAMTAPSCEGRNDIVEMRSIDTDGDGPTYEFLIGRFPITNQQFVTFLNDAQKDGGVTRRGSWMVFKVDGSVRTMGGTPFMLPATVPRASRLSYNQNASLGERYFVEAEFASHPVTGVSWFGAVKFCNWLTVVSGMGSEELCYTEGPTDVNWHPVTVSTQDWSIRDLSDDERRVLVTSFKGFRLPMDDSGLLAGVIDIVPTEHGEWVKAASYDDRAPDFLRIGTSGEAVSSNHWGFGFGRDTLSPGDANFWQSGDPYDNGTTPVGFYDGINVLAFNVGTTNASNNRFGVEDLSGNVFEIVQDRVLGTNTRAMRGGSWARGPAEVSIGRRDAISQDEVREDAGFRVVRVP